MIFEVGKTYQHSTGKRMTIIGRLKTHIYGECLIGEYDSGELIPVGESEENAVNWHEQECPFTAEKVEGISKDEIKPGDHITISGTVAEVIDDCGYMYFITKSGGTIWLKIEDIQTHRPMKEDHKE